MPIPVKPSPAFTVVGSTFFGIKKPYILRGLMLFYPLSILFTPHERIRAGAGVIKNSHKINGKFYEFLFGQTIVI